MEVDRLLPEIAQKPNRIALDGPAQAARTRLVTYFAPDKRHGADEAAHLALERNLTIAYPGARRVPDIPCWADMTVAGHEHRSHDQTKNRPSPLCARPRCCDRRVHNLVPDSAFEAVIPSSARRKQPRPLDREAYRRRNLIDRMLCRLKDFRRIATRYDRLAENVLSALALVATIYF